MALQRLHAIDEHCARLRTEIAVVESTLRGDPELLRLEHEAEAAANAARAAEAGAAAAEAESNALQRRVRDLDRKLYGGSVRNPQELVDMQRKLESLRERLGGVDDRTLGALEEAETARGAAGAAERGAAARAALRAGELEPLRLRLEVLRADLDAATAARAQEAGAVGAADLSLYTRVAARRRPAVVALEGESCGGCHLPISIEERRWVRNGDGLVQCSNCDRILVS